MKYLPLSMVLITTLTSQVIQGDDNLHPLSDEFINAINQNQSLWRAGRNFEKDIPLSYLKNLMGHRPSKVRHQLPTVRHEIMDSDLPESFDWRDIYPNCTSLFDIRDQGACGSCWAFGAVEAISDRICIHSDGKLNVSISADDVVSCCKNCGNGCFGGNGVVAYYYWKHTGIVTGGAYNSSQGCRPYEIPPSKYQGQSPRSSCTKEELHVTPICNKTCRDGYPIAYKNDLHFGESVYVIHNDVQQMQIEILKNGPVTVSFEVFEDFISYKSGVYKHVKGKSLDFHTVKILGWGVENDTPYWLIANSWNTHWGNKGYFKMLRGENHCLIEDRAVGGIPLKR